MGLRTKEHRAECSVNLYMRFVNEHRKDRLCGKPLLPMTAEDLCSYIDYKIQRCKYSTMQKQVSVLQYHPKHGDHWRKKVFESLPVIKKLTYYREAEALSTRLPSPPVPVIETPHNCQVVPGATRGFMVTAVKPPTPSPSPPRHQNEVKERVSFALTPEEVVQPKRKTMDTDYSSLTKPKYVSINGTRVVQMDVNELACKVRIHSHATSIFQRPRPVNPPPRGAVVFIGQDPVNC